MSIEIETTRLLNRLDIRFHAYQIAARKCIENPLLSLDPVSTARQNLVYALIQTEYLMPGLYQSPKFAELDYLVSVVRTGLNPIIATLYDNVTYDSLIGTEFTEVDSIEYRYSGMSLLNIERQLESKYTFVAQNADFGELGSEACAVDAEDRVIQRLIFSGIDPSLHHIHSHNVKIGEVSVSYKWVTVPKSSAGDILSAILKSHGINK